MAVERVEYPVGDGDSILVEVEVGPRFEPTSRRVDGVGRAGETLESALDHLRPVTAALVKTLTALAPSEVKVEFGVKLSGEAGAIIARTGVEGHFTVTLTFPGPAGGVEASAG